MYQKKNIEVLLLDDEIDEIIISSVPKYDEKDLKSVNRSGAADDFSEKSDKDVEKSLQPVIKKIKKVLGDKVKDVKLSNRLSDSPSCIVVDENDPTAQMQEIMRATGQVGITVTGKGIPLDAYKLDHACGAVEAAVIEQKDKDVVIVEGQGSIMHPGSSATLP